MATTRTGRPLVMRPMMYGSMGISAVFGFILGWEKAHARVMGFRENAPEVAKFAELDAKAATAAVGDKETVAASSAEAASSTSGQSS